MVGLSFASVTVIVLSDLIPEYLQVLPTILIVTMLALILALFKIASRFAGAFEICNLSFYLFFCAVGAMINVKKAIVLSPVLFGYTLITIIVHLIFVCGIGKLLRLDIRILILASVARATGPQIVIALADAHGWKTLVLPGVAIGLLGYAVGNYFGFAAAYILKALLGL